MNHQILNIAHRGASEYFPDNTLESFDQALRESADMLELDVRKTVDGRLVLFHDWYVMAGPNDEPDMRVTRLVSHVSYDELQAACEAMGFRLATLAEVLARYKNRIGLNIELKASGYEEDVADQIRELGEVENVVVSSFLPWVIAKIKNIDARIKTGWIIGQEQVILLNRLARPVVFMIFKELEAWSAHLQHEIAAPSVVGQFHKRGIPVYVWTVNDPAAMRELVDMGVDGIITNRPGVLHSVLHPVTAGPIAPNESAARIPTAEKADRPRDRS